MDGLISFIVSLFWLAFLAGLILAAVAVWGYNTLRRLAEEVKEAQSNVDVALRKKIGLLNRLSEAANSYLQHEKLVTLKVSQDASQAALQDAYQQSSTVFASLQGLAQKFPDLQASKQFKELAPLVESAESDLQRWRVACNRAVKDYNSRRGGLPHVLYANALGFRAARYLELEAIESGDSVVERPIISDDGDRVNELLGMAGSKMLGATRTLASQGKLLAEKAATRVQSELAARAAATPEYHYLDVTKSPQGPVSRSELDQLFRTGTISGETDVLEAGSRGWTTYASLPGPSTVEP